jgi:hypothetical protein
MPLSGRRLSQFLFTVCLLCGGLWGIIFGVFEYFRGCNPLYKITCPLYDEYTGIIKSVDVIDDLVHSCFKGNSDNDQTGYFRYCYTLLVRTESGHSKCIYKVTSQTNKENVVHESYNYEVGSHIYLLKYLLQHERCVDADEPYEHYTKSVDLLILGTLLLIPSIILTRKYDLINGNYEVVEQAEVNDEL